MDPPTPDLNLDNPLWRFSVGFYGHPEVSSCCLRLQRRFDFDINLVMLCLWCAHQQRAVLSRRMILDLRDAIALTVDNVREIRRVRMRIGEDVEIEPALEAAYDHLKHAELVTEQIEQAQLFQLFVRATRSDPCQTAPTELEAATMSLEHYAALLVAKDAAPRLKTLVEHLGAWAGSISS